MAAYASRTGLGVAADADVEDPLYGGGGVGVDARLDACVASLRAAADGVVLHLLDLAARVEAVNMGGGGAGAAGAGGATVAVVGGGATLREAVRQACLCPLLHPDATPGRTLGGGPARPPVVAIMPNRSDGWRPVVWREGDDRGGEDDAGVGGGGTLFTTRVQGGRQLVVRSQKRPK